MKRIISILLTISLLASALMCLVSCKFEKDDDDRTSSKKDKKHSYISQEQKNTWHDKLYALLLKSDIHDSELGLLGSYAAGLMDFDLDNTPELVLAYYGGSMGNLPLEIYDINTGEKLADYDSSMYGERHTACIYVAEKDNEYVVLSEKTFRIPPTDSVSFITLIRANKDSDSYFKDSTNLFYLETLDNQATILYEYQGQSVEKDEYDKKYQQFSEEYEKIEETQIQLIKWSTFGKLEWKDFGDKEGIDPESRQRLVEQMTDALLSSTQQFIKYDLFESSDPPQESGSNKSDTNEGTENNNTDKETEPETKTELSEKYPSVPKAFDNILDAYVDIANLTRYEGCTTRGSINDKDYSKVSKKHIDVIFNSLIDGWSWRNGVDGYFAGYAIKDINGDEIPELFLTDAEYTIYAAFAHVNGEIISHYFSFYYNDSIVALDTNGYFYMNDLGKGECEWYKILQLGTDGEFYGTEFGHYDMTGFGDPDVYNYYHTTSANSSNKTRITDEEYDNLVASYNKALKSLDPDGCGKPNHVTSTAGLEFYQVITEDRRK